MKILFVTPYLASPPQFGAQRRLDGLMRGLSKQHDVYLLSLAAPGPGLDAAVAAARDYCRDVAIVGYDVLNPDLTFKRALQLRSLVSRHSFETLLMRRPEFQARLDEHLARHAFDVVQVEFAQMGVYRFGRQNGRAFKLVLDEHNVEYDLLKRTAEAQGSAARKLYSAANWRKLRLEELAAWRRFDGVVLTSKRDEDVVRQELPSAVTSVVPNAVDVDRFKPSGDPPLPESLLFLGAVNYYPNTDGILYFLDAIYPKITRRRSTVSLKIVGMNPPPAITSRRSQNIEVTGFVDDPLPYLDQATAVIVPLRIGGGTRFKIVEAMAMGKAIVSTRLGAEGIDLVHDEHALLADEPDDFARQVDRVVADHALRDRLGQAARKLAIERYGWPAAVNKLEQFYGAVPVRGGR
jgi:polysaccharide biosynthesis protein PslH